MYKLYLLAVTVLILLGSFIFFHSNDEYSPSPLPLEERVDSLLALMNLEEKIGQLVLFTSDIDVTGPTIREGYKEDIQSGAVGALSNAYGADFTRELQKIAVEETRLGIPLLFGYDVIHGHKTIFPISLGQRASWDLIGSWSAAGDPDQAIRLLKGLKDNIEAGMKIRYAKGSEIEGEDTGKFEEAIEAAKSADFVIGRPWASEWLDSLPVAILETWFLGTQAGHAIADILLGYYNLSGKIPITFPRNVGQVPIFYSTKNIGRPFNEKGKYTSKYLDVANSPLYPFGYGLSYSRFTYRDLAWTRKITKWMKQYIFR